MSSSVNPGENESGRPRLPPNYELLKIIGDAMKEENDWDAQEIRPRLFLGSFWASEVAAGKGITHVLRMGPFWAEMDGVKRVHLIDIDDDEEANMLDRLPAALKFVQDSMAEPDSKVLVHCAAGVSRSTSVVLAYLMVTEGLSVDAALESVRQKRPFVGPNRGFMAQLSAFGAMGNKLDKKHVAYRHFQLSQARGRFENSGGVGDLSSAPEIGGGPSRPGAAAPAPQTRGLPGTPGVPSPTAEPGSSDALSDSPDAQDPDVTLYRCRKCRRSVASSLHVIPPDSLGEGWSRWGLNKPFERYGGRGGAGEGAGGSKQDRADASSLFVLPLRWMEESVVGQMRGKLFCPQCSARLGSFNWAGMQNTKGSWVTPAFQLHLKAMDVQEPRPPPNLRMGRVFMVASAPPPTASLGQTGELPRAMPKPGPDGRRFTHVIFDCDGVLVDTEAASCESLRLAVRQATGFDPPHKFPEDYYGVFGMDVRGCVLWYRDHFNLKADWGDAVGVSHRVAEAKEAIYQELTKKGIRAWDGAAALITGVQGLGIPVAVASSGSPEKIRHNLGSAGLISLFAEDDKLVSAKEVGRGKPFPDVYLEALRRIGCEDPSRCLVVEDAVHGLRAARAAGCYVVGVTNSLPRSHLDPHADLVVDSLEELREVLGLVA